MNPCVERKIESPDSKIGNQPDSPDRVLPSASVSEAQLQECATEYFTMFLKCTEGILHWINLMLTLTVENRTQVTEEEAQCAVTEAQKEQERL